jgi:hypothetical protein
MSFGDKRGNVMLKRRKRRRWRSRRTIISSVQSLLSLTGCIMATELSTNVIFNFIIK